MNKIWKPTSVDLVLSSVITLLILMLAGCTNLEKEESSIGAESWIRE